MRATQAVKRFHLARTVDAKLFRASIVAKYCDELLTENAELRDQVVALRSELARVEGVRKTTLRDVVARLRGRA